jgi:membrane protease YdiL (CAAX protease family)
MGGWRWKVLFKTFIAGLIIVGIPSIVWSFLQGKSGGVKFTIGGLILISVFVPLQGLGEELLFRGYITQTVSSWFRMTAIGVAVQILIFTVIHPYNIIGVISIAVSALIYALVCLCSKGIESPMVLHYFNNATEIYMAGFGYGLITADQTVPDTVFNLVLKTLFFLFILYADRKLHWFDEVKRDDVARFNSKRT